MQKAWLVKSKITKELKRKFPELNGIVLQLLHNRNLVTQDKIDEFLNPDYKDIGDPFLFKDMEKAVKRIQQAIEKNEKILIHGDYDADGVCSTALLVSVLNSLGTQNVDIYIPDRNKEGYGLNKKSVEGFSKQKIDLVITCDCGISNKAEIDLANELGIQVIITDHHHQPAELPNAYAIINPSVKNCGYPFSGLVGCAVAFKLAQALIDKSDIETNHEALEKWLLDLVAISTITDCAQVLGENRTLLKYGLVVLRKTSRVGLRELIKNANGELNKIDSQSIGFQIGPRLNAAGRIDHANTAFQLLDTSDKKEAEEIAEQLSKNNRKRQKITNDLMKKAISQIGDTVDQKILFAVGDGWPIGIVGLVAGKICEKSYRPTLVMGINGNKITGSGRSIPGFNIIEALEKADSILDEYGGHSGACGFTFSKDKLEDFKKILIQVATKELQNRDLSRTIDIDAEINLEDADWDLVNELNRFEPFGMGNEKPRFLLLGLDIANIQTIGKGDKHLRIIVNQGKIFNRKTIAFGFGEWAKKLKIRDKIDMICEVDVNHWNGSSEIQLRVVDLRIAGSVI